LGEGNDGCGIFTPASSGYDPVSIQGSASSRKVSAPKKQIFIARARLERIPDVSEAAVDPSYWLLARRNLVVRPAMARPTTSSRKAATLVGPIEILTMMSGYLYFILPERESSEK
jgi:hypothetical protein